MRGGGRGALAAPLLVQPGAAGRLLLQQQRFEHRLAVAAQRAVWVDDGEARQQLGDPAVLVVA